MPFKINLVNNYYNRSRNKNQFSFLFDTFTKSDWIKELTVVDSNLYLFIKEEVEEFFYNTGGYLTYLDFEACYNLAVEATIRQVKKSIRKKKAFFEIKNNDNSLIYKKVKERLLSNLRNLFDKKRRINVLNIDLWLMDNVYESYELDTITTLLDLKKLVNSDPEIIISNIIKLSKSFEITSSEINELAEKLNMNFSNIRELNLSLQFRNIKKYDNNQTYFSFFDEDFEEVA